jgi:hypothetical protein
MKLKKIFPAIAVAVFVAASSLLSAPAAVSSVKAVQYPEPVITPASPIQGDSVSLWLVLGQNPTSCVPYYITSFSIQPNFTGRCANPPCTTTAHYTIRVHYFEEIIMETMASQAQNFVAPPPGICAQIVTQYGPRFNFGALNAGQYMVIDSASGTTITSFDVGASMQTSAISGQVFIDNGTPAPASTLPQCKVYLSQYLLIYNSVAMPYKPPTTVVDSTLTGANGNFTFSAVAKGSYQLSFVAPGFQTYTTSVSVPPDTFITASLLKTGACASVKGTVRTSKCRTYGVAAPTCTVVPVAGCTVTVAYPVYNVALKKAADTIVGPLPPLYGQYFAVTDTNGRYSIDSLPVYYTSRTVTVTAFKSDYVQDSKDVSLYPGSATIADFMLVKGFTNTASNTVDGITFTIATDKASYLPYEAIKVRYWLKNNGMAAVTFTTSAGGCEFEMTVADALGKKIFGSLDAVDCPKVAQQLTLNPGDSAGTEFSPYYPMDTLSPLSITAKLTGYEKSAVTVPVVISGGNTAMRPPVQGTAKAATPGVRYVAAAHSIVLTLDKAQNVSIAAFTMSGRQIPSLSSSSFYSAGTHTIGLGKARVADGVVVLRIQGAKFNMTKRVNLLETR